MDDFVRVAAVSDFTEGRGRTVTIDGEAIAVFRRKGRFIAVGDKCPHMGASMAMGFVSQGFVQCAWHGWKFSLVDGVCTFRDWARLPLHDVRVEGGEVLIRRPRRPEPAPEPAEEPWMTWDPNRSGKN